MLATDEHAENLFARLFSYAPREKRNSLEDYCTESLAWLLIKSQTFADEFLKMVRNQLKLSGTLNKKLDNYAGKLSVSTQESYTLGEDAADTQGGRFDLVLRPARGDDFIVVLESKVGLDPTIGSQAKEYTKQLKKHRQFNSVTDGERYVLTLTPAAGTPRGADAHVSWCNVYELLERLGERDKPHDLFKPWFKHRRPASTKANGPPILMSFKLTPWAAWASPCAVMSLMS